MNVFDETDKILNAAEEKARLACLEARNTVVQYWADYRAECSAFNQAARLRCLERIKALPSAKQIRAQHIQKAKAECREMRTRLEITGSL